MGPEASAPWPDRVEVLVVGAGMAGLTAARILSERGRRVLVVDKGRYPGGRIATRRVAEAAFDHGATFFSPVGGPFTQALDRWRDAQAVGIWPGLEEGQEHWRSRPDNRGFAAYLARGLPVRTRTRLVKVGPHDEGWRAETETGASVTAAAILMTPPVPQILNLLAQGDTVLEPKIQAQLEQIRYQRCLVVMAVLAGPSAVLAPGLFEPARGPIARIIDEGAKGSSPVPAVTIHAEAAFSRERWDDDRDEVAAELLAAADAWLGSSVMESRIHGWKFSRPVQTWPTPCLVAVDRPPLVLAGDAFGGPDLSGAYRSGLTAAEILGGADSG